jgi:hypothetical protein
VVIRGSLAGYEDHGSTTERLIRVIGQGRFWGGTNLLTGQPARGIEVGQLQVLSGA